MPKRRVERNRTADPRRSGKPQEPACYRESIVPIAKKFLVRTWAPEKIHFLAVIVDDLFAGYTINHECHVLPKPRSLLFLDGIADLFEDLVALPRLLKLQLRPMDICVNAVGRFGNIRELGGEFFILQLFA